MHGICPARRQQPDQRRHAPALPHAVSVDPVVVRAQAPQRRSGRLTHGVCPARRQQPDQGRHAPARADAVAVLGGVPEQGCQRNRSPLLRSSSSPSRRCWTHPCSRHACRDARHRRPDQPARISSQRSRARQGRCQARAGPPASQCRRLVRAAHCRRVGAQASAARGARARRRARARASRSSHPRRPRCRSGPGAGRVAGLVRRPMLGTACTCANRTSTPMCAWGGPRHRHAPPTEAGQGAGSSDAAAAPACGQQSARVSSGALLCTRWPLPGLCLAIWSLSQAQIAHVL